MVNSGDKFYNYQQNDTQYLALAIFQQKKPRSRVVLDIVRLLQQKIENTPSINHKHFVEYQGVEQVNGEYCLLTSTSKKYYPLEDYLKENDVSLHKKVEWAVNIAEVAKVAEARNCEWPGLTLSSLKVDVDGDIKVVDPEITNIIRQYQAQAETISTACFTPPAIIKDEKWDEQSRLYSFGVILYYLCTGEVPFTGDNKSDIMDRVLNYSIIEPRFINHQLSFELNDLILQLLTRAEKKRISTWDEMLPQLNYICENNLAKASRKQENSNRKQSDKVVKAISLKNRYSLFFRKQGKVVAVVAVIVGLMAATFFFGGSEQVVITPETPPAQVVEHFYRALAEKNTIVMDQATDLDLGRLGGMISEGHVIEKMREAYSSVPLDNENGSSSGGAVFGIRDLNIAVQSPKPEPVFTAAYVFFINLPAGQKTAEMKDTLILEYRDKWQIIDLKGDIKQLIRGEFVFE